MSRELSGNTNPLLSRVLASCTPAPHQGRAFQVTASRPRQKPKTALWISSCLISDIYCSEKDELRYQVMRDMGFLQGSTNSPRQVREGKGKSLVRETQLAAGKWRSQIKTSSCKPPARDLASEQNKAMIGSPLNMLSWWEKIQQICVSDLASARLSGGSTRTTMESQPMAAR
jgi:hypothetical protein